MASEAHGEDEHEEVHEEDIRTRGSRRDAAAHPAFDARKLADPYAQVLES